MPRFSRKPQAKDKQTQGKPSKSGKTKGKSEKQEVFASVYEETDARNNFIGVQQCRKLLASVSEKTSAKCMATFRRKSQLSKTLPEVLMDDTVLPYFMEYMQKQNATNLLNFWLTAETFRLSTINRLKVNSISRLKTSKIDSTATNINEREVVFSNFDATNSFDLPSTSGLSEGVNNEQHHIYVDNNDHDFGEFTGYEATNSNAAVSKVASTSRRVHFCSKCGRVIKAPLLKKGVCDSCGHTIVDSELNGKVFSDSSLSVRPKESTSAAVGIQNGIGDNNMGNQSIVKNIQGPAEGSDEDTCSLQQCLASKVTFDLKPDFEHVQREFCCRRTRSIVIDAVSIYSKYISLEATHPIGLEESMRQQIEINICSEDGRICPESFQPAQMFVFNVMERMYFPTFLGSSFYFKHQIDILTSGKVFLSDIMYNENAMFYFMEHLEREGVQHMLEFWLTADNFQCHVKSQLETRKYNAENALDDAMIIYDKYFSMQASLPLGVDDATRIEIENSICREGGPLSDCFSSPMELVLCLLEEVLFPSFLQSEVYFKYLTELLNSVSERQSSNELSASGSSTGDVRGSASQISEKSRLMRSSLGSDPDLAQNPDAIWQRPNAGPLSLGKVNEFGIFEPIFEPDPDRDNGLSTAAKLGKAMKKLVSGVEDKAKEEMAWKIAKMIIEDVKNEQASS